MCSVSRDGGRLEPGQCVQCPDTELQQWSELLQEVTSSSQSSGGAMTRSLVTNNNNSTTAHSMMDGVSNSHSINRWINGLMARDSNCDKINVVK